MTEDPFEAAVQDFEEAARQLELAVQHLRTTAQHFRDHNVPRGCAHAFAAQGHMLRAQQYMDKRAMVHAEKAVP